AKRRTSTMPPSLPRFARAVPRMPQGPLLYLALGFLISAPSVYASALCHSLGLSFRPQCRVSCAIAQVTHSPNGRPLLYSSTLTLFHSYTLPLLLLFLPALYSPHRDEAPLHPPLRPPSHSRLLAFPRRSR